ncbi:STAS domain-containing protein [Nonomuraea lactucae]|uniref:STAS domain-containing protein n=1 Tax=Nonomuraea lactucae TaxID=2249762 RepID=UPI000DE3AEC3|nr:STAS domain-containing protein [Nonomuraea lactucae]
MPTRLAIVPQHLGDTAVVTLAGELDKISAPRLEGTLSGLLSGGHRHLVLDVAELEFCDVAGLRLFLDFERQTRQAGGRLRLAAVGGVLRRLIQLSCLDNAFLIDPDVTEALKACTRGAPGPGGQAKDTGES